MTVTVDGDGDAGSTTTPLLQHKLNYGGQTESGKIAELRDRIDSLAGTGCRRLALAHSYSTFWIMKTDRKTENSQASLRENMRFV